MNGIERIKEVFKKQKKCLIGFLAAGDPSLAESEKNCLTALETVDILEIGVPFSDPMADGAVIQDAYYRAITAGFRPNDVFTMVKRIKSNIDKPIILMVYVNLLLSHGEERFLQDAVASGVDGLIIPDLPPEESDSLRELATRYGIALNFLTAPTSTDARIKSAAEATTGFLYVVSVRGVTGERKEISQELPSFIARVKEQTDLPLAVGFGISQPDHVRNVFKLADGAIVGSALVKTLADAPSPELGRDSLKEKLKSLIAAVSR